MRVADTSVLYALVYEADAHHANAVRLVGDEDPILVPSEILVELAQLIVYRWDHTAARKALKDILSLPHVSIGPRVSVAAACALFETAGGRLSLADSFVVQTCRETGASALTFDAKLAKHARAGA